MNCRSSLMPALLVLLFSFVSYSASAEWYETTGEAIIYDGDKETAREKAIRDAFKQALLLAGASVTSLQEVTNGLLTQDTLEVRSFGSVRDFQVLHETYSEDLYQITIQTDIFPEERLCRSQEFKKTVSIESIHLANREQARVGNLFSLPKYLGNAITEQFRQFAKYAVLLNPKHYPAASYRLRFTIDDISLDKEETNKWYIWQDKKYDRFFRMTVSMMPHDSEEVIFNQQFSGRAPWTQDIYSNIDLRSGAFWNSAYGREITRSVENTIRGVDDVLMCQSIRGTVLKVLANNRVSIDLGSIHGVNKGQLLYLMHNADFIDHEGKKLPRHITTNKEFEIEQVYTNTAIARTVGSKFLGNVQVGDYLVDQ
ncbi:flagellar assembly protein T N-terminal domain-containing protein [Algicola sagamiensis]|uniref:flagellar assembly protein T N-terminal domain-containing protein n=1 Tax=Algicola sagamiensis TaxID=163869 RepID=UPI00039B7F9B|nr:flagellar assembly protein T N-terminal domain-containing protein [Algicola sagamiensis]